MMPRSRDAWAASLLSAGALGSAMLAFAVQATLARSLSASEYGRFAAAIAAVTIMAPAVGFGVPAFWLKAYGTEGWAARRWMKASVRFIACSAMLCVAATALWAWIGTADEHGGQLLLWMLPVVLTQCAIEIASAKLQLEERFGHVAMWQALQHSARLGLVLVCWKLGASGNLIAAGFGCIGAVVTLGAWRSLSILRNGTAELVGHGSKIAVKNVGEYSPIPSMADLWRNAMPFGVSSLLFYAFSQCGTLILSLLGSARDVGAYSIAVTVLAALYLLPSVLFQKLLMPRLHRWAASGDKRLEKMYRDGAKWTFAAGVTFACMAAWLAPSAIPLLFGSRYEHAVSVVVLMTLGAPFRFLTVCASSVMTTGDLIRVRNRCAAGALLFGAISAVFGVVLASSVGVAVASVLSEIVWAALSVVCARHLLSRERGRTLSAAEAQREACHMSPQPPGMIPVSVIIPCFNCRDTLERAVESVFRQTCRPQELILVDDCSSDGTRELIGELTQSYPGNWIRAHFQLRNAGPGAARNAGWAIATQPYIAFLDSDDSWHPSKIAIQYGWMSSHPEAAITGHPVALIESGQRTARLSRPRGLEPRRIFRHRILFSNRFTPSSIVIRANLHARFDEKKYHAEDYFMLLEVALTDRGAAYLFPFPLSYVYKAQFGAQSGLSGQLWKIQKGEQDNYLGLRRRGMINNVEWIMYSTLSAAKYLRRCMLSMRLT